MGTPTQHFGFDRPTVGGDEDNWGDDYATGDPTVDPSPGLNGNWSKMDALLKLTNDAISELQTKVADLEGQIEIPIGGFFISDIISDPAATLGYGTWTAWGEGRALVGAGDSGSGTVRAAGDTFGSDEHQLTVGELPTHTHDLNDVTVDEAGEHNHGIETWVADGDGPNRVSRSYVGTGATINPTSVQQDGAHTHTISGNIGSTGLNEAHSSEQASEVAYIWKRTA